MSGVEVRRCWFCGRTDCLERHHVWAGGRRKISDREGFVVDLCHWCHNEPPSGVHFNKINDLTLKRAIQSEYEKTHTRAQFMALIGKNYLD